MTDTSTDPPVYSTDPVANQAILDHIAAQADAPEGHVVLSDGTIRPVGGHGDNA